MDLLLELLSLLLQLITARDLGFLVYRLDKITGLSIQDVALSVIEVFSELLLKSARTLKKRVLCLHIFFVQILNFLFTC